MTYTYDPFGRRIEKNVNGVITQYVYSTEGLIGEYDAGGNITRTYGYHPSSTFTTDPLFMKQGSEVYFYHNDGSGTPQKITNSNGAVVWQATYSSFGKATVDANSTITNNIRFPGQYFDSETGLHYNFYRFYEPETGRYITRDPVGFEGGDVNLYAYVRNNSTNWIDPSGLVCIYTQFTGSLICTNNGVPYLICNGYSGKGVGWNNPYMQDIPFVGPIPGGDYSTGVPNGSKGPITIPLTPINPGNKISPVIIPRSGFLIHGDNNLGNNSASEGCIIIPPKCRKMIPVGETVRVIQ